MRIAVLIITLCLTAIVALQSCAVAVGDNLSQQAGGGAVGIFVAFFLLLGAAFVMALPKISIAMFGIAALLGLVAGATTSFGDMTIWGGVAAVLAVMAYLGSRELSKKRAVQPADGQKPAA